MTQATKLYPVDGNIAYLMETIQKARDNILMKGAGTPKYVWIHHTLLAALPPLLKTLYGLEVRTVTEKELEDLGTIFGDGTPVWDPNIIYFTEKDLFEIDPNPITLKQD